jgi:hypothetical protein
MEHLMYDEGGLWVYVVVTVLLGGGGAFSTGRALARSWHDWPMVIVAMFGLTFGVRFIHFALFEETLLSLHFYLADFVTLCVIGLLGHRYTRAGQMTTQYRWLYERTSPLSWTEKPPVA